MPMTVGLLAEYYFALYEPYDSSKTYNKEEHVFEVSSRSEFDNNKETIFRLLDRGFKLIVSTLESNPSILHTEFHKDYLQNIIAISCSVNPVMIEGYPKKITIPNVWWYNQGRHRPEKNNPYHYDKSKLFLMPIRYQRWHKDLIFDKLAPFLDRSVYSYVQREGKELPNSSASLSPGVEFEYRAEWYNDTYFSVVVETAIHNEPLPPRGMHCCDLMITEKTFKPIRYQHPFLLFCYPGALGYLKQQGFVTYNNLFDESYDENPDHNKRIDIIYDNVANFDVNEYYSQQTKDRLAHNYAHFHDIAYIKKCIMRELYQPLMEFISDHMPELTVSPYVSNLWGQDRIPVQNKPHSQTVYWTGSDNEEAFKRNKPAGYTPTSITYTYNRYGYRTPDFELNNGKRNILCLGCSHTEGVGLNEQYTWPSVMKTYFSEKNVYNLGVGGTSGDFAVRLLYNIVNMFDPEVVFLLWPPANRIELITNRSGIQTLSVSTIQHPDQMDFLDDAFCYNYYQKNLVMLELMQVKYRIKVVTLTQDEILTAPGFVAAGKDRPARDGHYSAGQHQIIASTFFNKFTV